jgi:hypothetical protein
MSRAVGHVVASGLRLGGEQKRMRIGPHLAGPRHVSIPDPCLGPVQGPCTFRPGTLGPHYGQPGPIQRGSDPIPEVQLAHVEVRDQPWGPDYISGGPGPTLEVRTVYPGVRRSPVGVRITVDALEYITFLGHVVAPDPPMRWSRALLWT